MPWEATPPANLIEDKFRLEIGLWQTGVDTVIRADATPEQPGTTLDAESDVGLTDTKLMPELELTLLPAKHHLVRLNTFSSHRSGQAVLTEDVQFDGNDYFTGELVKSTLNLDMVGLGYGYRLFNTPRYELDLGVDVQIASVESNVYVPRRFVREADAGVLPIPLLDVDGRWNVWRNWQLLGRYRWLGGSGNDGDVKGSLRDWRFGVQWQFSQHIGVGLLYRHFGVAVDSGSTSHPGSLRLDYSGAELAFRASL